VEEELPEIHFPLPIGSMYDIYANIWGILMVNVSIYTIHGSYGLASISAKRCKKYRKHINKFNIKWKSKRIKHRITNIISGNLLVDFGFARF